MISRIVSEALTDERLFKIAIAVKEMRKYGS